MDVNSVTSRQLLPPDTGKLGFDDLADLLQPFREFSTRDLRRVEAEYFIDSFAEFEHDYPVIRACTSGLGKLLWSDKWLGITWVALHGIDSMCVVVREDQLSNLKSKLSPVDINGPSYFYRLFWNAIVSNVEDIEDFKLRGGNLMRPFSVFTVCPSMDCKRIGGQASRAEYSSKYNATKTSNFLHDEMKSGATFSLEKTVQTAISALERLFCREFDADEIRVFVWDKNETVGREMPCGRKIPDLEELLATLRSS